jgi:hypothetical protein
MILKIHCAIDLEVVSITRRKGRGEYYGNERR